MKRFVAAALVVLLARAADAQQAIAIQDGQVIMGFSAGGHLAMTASTLFDGGVATAPDVIDRANSRPDFSVLAIR
jgi:dienelactone hydrolase